MSVKFDASLGKEPAVWIVVGREQKDAVIWETQIMCFCHDTLQQTHLCSATETVAAEMLHLLDPFGDASLSRMELI